MPRPKPPPTPSASTDLTATDRSIDREMESAFSLPPPAVHKKNTPPVSPVHKPMAAPSPRHKRTISGATKSKEDLSIPQYDLPPPPSRARKIIQMKPKSSNSSSSEGSQAATSSPKTTGSSKRKTPSASSAAGRKIARKTAHSIIERRRRSKMNEEFGVLKDMIPACEGVEMHKLAILQAGIEYVRYLEGCIKQLKGENEGQEAEYEYDDDEEDTVPTKRSATNSTTDWQYRKPSIASSSTNPSPEIIPLPRLQQPSHRPVLPSIPSFTASPALAPHSATPTPTLLSPAFNAIHFSPDLARTGTNSTATSISLLNASPHILPLPQISLDRRDNTSPANMSEGGAEATATAALMMLTKDRRSTMENRKGNGMSVKDLLTS